MRVIPVAAAVIALTAALAACGEAPPTRGAPVGGEQALVRDAGYGQQRTQFTDLFKRSGSETQTARYCDPGGHILLVTRNDTGDGWFYTATELAERCVPPHAIALH